MSKRSFSLPAKLAALFAVTAVCGLHITAANAGSANADLGVSASVTANCSISTAPLDFGAYDPTAASDATAQGTVSVLCTNGDAANITLGQGANADAGSTDAAPLRRMSDGGSQFLSYALFQNGALNTIWGNTSGTGASHTGDGTSHDLTVYGKLPKNQNVGAGSFADTVVATVTF